MRLQNRPSRSRVSASPSAISRERIVRGAVSTRKLARPSRERYRYSSSASAAERIQSIQRRRRCGVIESRHRVAEGAFPNVRQSPVRPPREPASAAGRDRSGSSRRGGNDHRSFKRPRTSPMADRPAAGMKSGMISKMIAPSAGSRGIEVRHDIHQVRFHEAGMGVQPEATLGHSAGEMDFPDPVQRNGRAKLLHALPAVARVAEDIVQVQQDSAIGRVGDFRDEIGIRHLARQRREITDRILESDGNAGGRAAMPVCGSPPAARPARHCAGGRKKPVRTGCSPLSASPRK